MPRSTGQTGGSPSRRWKNRLHWVAEQHVFSPAMSTPQLSSVDQDEQLIVSPVETEQPLPAPEGPAPEGPAPETAAPGSIVLDQGQPDENAQPDLAAEQEKQEEQAEHANKSVAPESFLESLTALSARLGTSVKPRENDTPQRTNRGGVVLPLSLGALGEAIDKARAARAGQHLYAAAQALSTLSRNHAVGSLDAQTAAALSETASRHLTKALGSPRAHRWMLQAGVSPDELDALNQSGAAWLSRLTKGRPDLEKAVGPLSNAFEHLKRLVQRVLAIAGVGQSPAPKETSASGPAPG
jgi:hypothetical protein